MKKLILLTISLVWSLLSPFASGQTSDSTLSNLRTCLQTTVLGIRNITGGDELINVNDFLSEAALIRKFNPNASTSKIPTELISTDIEIQDSESSVESKSGAAEQKPSVTTVSNGLHHASSTKATPQERIRYLLFTSRNKDQFQVMPEDGTVKGTFWNSRRKTKVLIHGLTSTEWFLSITNIWTQHIFEIKDAYLERTTGPEYNVVVVDWTSVSTVPVSRYPDAAYGTRFAGEDLSQFLLRLKRSNRIKSWDDVHLLGHSLGAHVAGVTGSKLIQMGEGPLSRITGLDPAGPCFDTPSGMVEDPSRILDSSDANFVDIIHTNMGNGLRNAIGRYGSSMQTGHVDFYPNGGEKQEGCNFLEDRLLYCSHQKSVVFYAKSISEHIMTCPCNDWESYRSMGCPCNLKTGGQFFGEYCDPKARGKYYLKV